MRFKRLTPMAIGAAICAPYAAVQAQESEAAPAAPRPSPPVFSLPPGDAVDPEPEPDIVGPRIPGQTAPRRNAPANRQPPAQTASPQRDSQPAQATADAGEESNMQSGSRPAQTQVPIRQAGNQVVTGPPGSVATAPNGAPPGSALPLDIRTSPTTRSPADMADAPAFDPAAPAPLADTGEGGLSPWWLALAGLLLAGGAGILWQRRRVALAGRAPEAIAPNAAAPTAPTRSAIPTRRLTPEPEAKPAVPPVAPAAPAAKAPAAKPPVRPDLVTTRPGGTITSSVVKARPERTRPVVSQTAGDTRPGRIEIHYEPISAKLGADGLSVDFKLHIENVGREPLSDIIVCLDLRTADTLTGPSPDKALSPLLTLDRLNVGERIERDGEMVLRADKITPVTVGGEPICIPVVDLIPQYRDASGTDHQRAITMLLGQEHEPPTAKVAPLPLDPPEAKFERLGCRILQLPENTAAAA